MIQKILSQTKLAIASILLLIGASVFFYIQFENFKPKQSVNLNDINGNRIASKNSIPKPNDAEILGVSRSDNTIQTTYETTSTSKEIQKFYKNILENDMWKLDIEEEIESTLKSKFIKENENITITTSPQENSEKTVVSVNQIKNN